MGKLPSKFFPLYKEFEECRRWIEDCSITLRRWRTVMDYARVFTEFVKFTGKNPKMLAKLSYDEALELMKKFALWRVRKKGISPKRVHMEWFALAGFFKLHGIKGEYPFPSRIIPVTVKYLDKIPNKEELQRILSAPRLDLSTKIAIHLIAYAGIRPEDACNLTYSCIKEDFEKGVTPCAVWVLQRKTNQAYVTFIPEETVSLFKQYFEERKEAGEQIRPTSPLIVDSRRFKSTGKVKGILQKSLSTRMTRALRKSGITLEEKIGDMARKMRPYSLKKYFRSNLTGHMPSEYIEALMGHTSGLEHIYGGTRDLDPATIERMREAYKKCEPFLLASIQPLDQSSVVKEAKIEALKTIAKSMFGIDLIEVKVAREKELGRELNKDEEIQLFEDELKKLREGQQDPQKIVREEELERYLAEGWEFVSVLPSQKILIKNNKIF
jgi:integrase